MRIREQIIDITMTTGVKQDDIIFKRGLSCIWRLKCILIFPQKVSTQLLVEIILGHWSFTEMNLVKFNELWQSTKVGWFSRIYYVWQQLKKATFTSSVVSDSKHQPGCTKERVPWIAITVDVSVCQTTNISTDHTTCEFYHDSLIQ